MAGWPDARHPWALPRIPLVLGGFTLRALPALTLRSCVRGAARAWSRLLGSCASVMMAATTLVVTVVVPPVSVRSFVRVPVT